MTKVKQERKMAVDLKCKDGWLEVICGCMFAGKTEELIRRINRIKYAKKILLFLNLLLIIDMIKNK